MIADVFVVLNTNICKAIYTKKLRKLYLIAIHLASANFSARDLASKICRKSVLVRHRDQFDKIQDNYVYSIQKQSLCSRMVSK